MEPLFSSPHRRGQMEAVWVGDCRSSDDLDGKPATTSSLIFLPWISSPFLFSSSSSFLFSSPCHFLPHLPCVEVKDSLCCFWARSEWINVSFLMAPSPSSSSSATAMLSLFSRRFKCGTTTIVGEIVLLSTRVAAREVCMSSCNIGCLTDLGGKVLLVSSIVSSLPSPLCLHIIYRNNVIWSCPSYGTISLLEKCRHIQYHSPKRKCPKVETNNPYPTECFFDWLSNRICN